MIGPGLLSKLAALSGVMVMAFCESSLAYTLPSEPISPTNIQECRNLYARFMAVREGVVAEAKATGDRAWQIAKSGRIAQARPVYGESSRLHDEAFRILSEAQRARSRCEMQVRANETLRARSVANSREASRLSANVGGKVAKVSGNNLLKYVERYSGNSGRSASASTLSKAWTAWELANNISGRNGYPGYIHSGLWGLNQVGARAGIDGYLGPLQTFLTNTAVAVFSDIHSQAVADFTAAMQAFASAEDIAGRIESARLETEGILGGRRVGQYAELKARAYDLPSPVDWREVIAQTNQAYAAREVKPPSPKPSVNQTKSSSRSVARGPRRSSIQCQQLLGQIAELRRVLPAYRARGYGGQIEQGIRENQREFNRVCR